MQEKEASVAVEMQLKSNTKGGRIFLRLRWVMALG